MKRVLALAACLMLLAATPAVACWMFLPISEMEQQAEIIIIGELNGNVRQTRNSDGSGTIHWSIDVLHVLKGEAGETMEVATGGFLASNPGATVVMVSTDYRLDSYGGLVLLYLSEDFGDGNYWPVTPRGIVPLKRMEGGEVFGIYTIVSEQHEGEHEEILESIERLAEDGLVVSAMEAQSKAPKESLPLFAATTGAFSLAVLVLREKKPQA